MNPYALLPLAGFVANVVLAGIVYARSPRDLPNRIYAALCLSIAWWSILKFARLLIADEAAAVLLFQISAVGWCLLPSLYLHFVVAFTKSPLPGGVWTPRVLHGAGAGLAAVAFVPGAMSTDMLWEPWGSSHEPGPVYDVFAVYSFALFVAGLALLVAARRRADTRAQRRQLDFVIVGGMIPVVAGSVTNIWLPVAGIFVVPLGEVLSTLNVAAVAWAMARHGLLSVSLEQAAETIVATMGDALLVVNTEGDVVVANRAAARLLRRSRPDLVGRPVRRFLKSPILDEPGSSFPAGEVSDVEGELLPDDDDAVPVIVTTNPVRDATGVVTGAVLVAKDIRQLRGAMMELAAANQRLERQSITDELTGVSNRRHTNQRLAEEFELACRYRRPFTVGVLDLDDFKQVNDRFGHQIGDRVLEAVAREIQGVLRDADVVSRWGGDEFFVILNETDADHALEIGRRIVARIETANVPGLDGPIGASLGLATFDPEHPPEDAGALVSSADEALYAAKRAGKGRVHDSQAVTVAVRAAT